MVPYSPPPASNGQTRWYCTRCGTVEPVATAVKVYRPPSGRLRIRMPYADGNRRWLREVCGPRSHVGRDAGAWEVAAKHLPGVVDALLDRFGEVELIKDHQRGRGLCDTRCTNAAGDDCTCKCAGRNHRAGWLAGYMQVNDTTLVEFADVVRTSLLLRRGDLHLEAS